MMVFLYGFKLQFLGHLEVDDELLLNPMSHSTDMSAGPVIESHSVGFKFRNFGIQMNDPMILIIHHLCRIQPFKLSTNSRYLSSPSHANGFNTAPTSGLILANMSLVVLTGFQPIDRERSARQRAFVPK